MPLFRLWCLFPRTLASPEGIQYNFSLALRVDQVLAMPLCHEHAPGNRPLQLRLSRYSAAYKGRLIHAAGILDGFLKAKGLSIVSFARMSPSYIDLVLTEFIAVLFDKKQKPSLSVAKHAVLFLQILRPALKGKMAESWQSLRSWEELQPGNLRSPLPFPILVLMVIVCRAKAMQLAGQSQRIWLAFSVLLEVGFHCLLRPGELLNIRKQDITLPHSCNFGGACVAIRLNFPKNRRYLGRQQFVSLHHPHVINWLSWLYFSTRRPDDKLWGLSAATFRWYFRAIVETLGLSRFKFSPASLRAGGATFRFQTGTQVSTLRFLGRWASDKSLEHYIQLATSHQIVLQLTNSEARKYRRWLTKGFYMLQISQQLISSVPVSHRVQEFPLSEPPSRQPVAWVVSYGMGVPFQERKGQSWISSGGSLRRH